MDSDAKVIRFEYIRRNKTLIETLYYCRGFFDLTYEEIVENLEEKGENTAGLLIRIERGINLGLIKYDGTSSLKDRKYRLGEVGIELFESGRFFIYEDMRLLAKEVMKRAKKEIKKAEEKRRYII